MVSGQRLFQSHLNRRGPRHLRQIFLHQQIRLQNRRNPVNGLLEEVHIQPYSRYHTDRRGHRNNVVFAYFKGIEIVINDCIHKIIGAFAILH